MTTPDEATPPPDWARIRERVPLEPGVTMLNTGSFGPTSEPVFARVTELRHKQAAGPTDFFTRQLPPLLWNARQRFADFVGCTPSRVVFTANVSMAVNIVANGLTVDGPGELLMSDWEYLPMQWCWERYAERHGLRIKLFRVDHPPASAEAIVDAAVAAMNSETKLLFFSHIFSPTGLVLPASRLCQAARERGIVSVVDGAHAPALIPLDTNEIGADYYTGNCHKWLLAPFGAGFLIANENRLAQLEPTNISWGYKANEYPLGIPEAGHTPDSPDRFGSTERTRRLEFEGTREICSWLVIPEAIDFLASIGWEPIRQRTQQLSHYCRQRIGAERNLAALTPATADLSAAMTAFRLPEGIDLNRLRSELWDRERIEVPVFERNGFSILRVSHYFYNTEAEIDHLAQVLAKFLKG